MSEQIKGMKDAVMGQGGGLQETSSKVGETIAENTDMRGGQSKKSDEATASLGQFAGGSKGQTQEGTSIGAAQQVANQESGTANHLELGK